LFNLDDGHGKHDSHEGTSSFTTASFQIANTIMGAGILSLPMVMQYLGLIVGTLFISLVALCTIYSVNLLLKCKDLTGKRYKNINILVGIQCLLKFVMVELVLWQ
jgi:amino acid permease